MRSSRSLGGGAQGKLARRAYDKGERRFKHVAKGDEPQIEFDPGNPKKWIGKCPAGLSVKDMLRLVNEAVAAGNGDRRLVPPKRVYNVHKGAIYEAQTSDGGKTYHGYPYRGKLASGLIETLRAMAVKKECEKEFDKWLEQHVEPHGR